MLYAELFKQLESVRWDMDQDVPWARFDAGVNVLDPVGQAIGAGRRPVAHPVAARVEIDDAVTRRDQRRHRAGPAVPGLPAAVQQHDRGRALRPADVACQRQSVSGAELPCLELQ